MERAVRQALERLMVSNRILPVSILRRRALVASPILAEERVERLLIKRPAFRQITDLHGYVALHPSYVLPRP